MQDHSIIISTILKQIHRVIEPKNCLGWYVNTCLTLNQSGTSVYMLLPALK